MFILKIFVIVAFCKFNFNDRYTFGKRVNGYASMSMKLQDMWSDLMHVTKNVEVIHMQVYYIFYCLGYSN